MKQHSATSVTHVPAPELPEPEQVELLASLLEILSTEEQWSSNVKMCVICVGWLVYAADMQGELRDLCRVMDTQGILGKVQAQTAEDRLLVREVGSLVG